MVRPINRTQGARTAMAVSVNRWNPAKKKLCSFIRPEEFRVHIFKWSMEDSGNEL